MKGILLDKDNDLAINIKRDSEGKIVSGLVVSDSELQDAYMVLSLNQGELKEDPIAGVNLISLIRGKMDSSHIKSIIKIGFKRCGIDFDLVKDKMQIMGIDL